MSLIEIRELKKLYTTYQRGSTFREAVKSLFVRRKIEIEALKGLNLDIEEGELIGFLGPNGAGKSTTMKILTGVLYPTSGSVTAMGLTPWKDRSRYVSKIGAVFGQKSQLIWDIPPADAFEMNRAIYGIGGNDFKKRLGGLVELLNLEDIINKPTRQLSLGERMKCEFIMAMLHEPAIVFLDEPTIGLDVVAKDRIRNFIAEKNKNGTTFILTTHDLSDIERLANRVVVINHGEVVYDDALEALRLYYGSKKLISLSSEKPISGLSELPGISILNTQSPFHADVELDLELLTLNSFIKLAEEQFGIKDITISNPEIESIIKGIYAER